MRTHLPSIVTAATLTAGLLLVPGTAAFSAHAAASDTTAGTDPIASACSAPVIDEAAPVAEAIETNTDRTEIREANDLTRAQMRQVEADPAAWADECARVFFVEEGHHPGDDSPVPVPPAPVDPLTLESNPGAARTIYLDFDGATVTGTEWNRIYGSSTIKSSPYSRNWPTDTAFDAEERAHIATAWAVVAEDFAPFDVNVTTSDPGSAALSRTSTSDTTYGTRVVITDSNTVGDNCRCGGIAYVDVFSETSTAYQPAWVFTDAASDDGHHLAQAISHEVGHNFGLLHDGTSKTAYSLGGKGWAPIMGASYFERVSQWSAGEYADANNKQDDAAIIATEAKVRADDHGNITAHATPLTGTPVAGLIETRTDQDAFTFAASGKTTLSVAGPTGLSNTDLSLRILDVSGKTVITRNPTSTSEYGMHANWWVTLPDTPALYTAIVDGVGNGNPYNTGQYSDYGSLGRYTLTLSTDAPAPPPLTITPIASTVTGYTDAALGDFPVVSVAGGVAPYKYAVSGLPGGLTLNSTTGNVCCAVSSPVDMTSIVTVTDQQGLTASASVRFTFTTEPVTPPVATPSTPDPTPPTTPVGTPPVVTPPVGPQDPGDGDDDMSGPAAKRAQWATKARLPNAHAGHRYRTAIRVVGKGHYTWQTRGKLPHGFKAKIRNGQMVITGKPSATGKIKIAVTVRCTTNGDTLTRTFVLRVRR